MLCSDPIAEPLQGYLSLSTYGMGFFIDSYRGASVVQHGGHIDGFIADQCFVPEKNFACAVLTNSEHPYGARVMRYHLLDAVLGLESVDWAGPVSYTHLFRIGGQRPRNADSLALAAGKLMRKAG